MAALLDEFPAIRLNINLVPSLLIQLDDYAQGRAQDRFLEVSRCPAGALTSDDHLFLLENFFMAHWENMVDPHPRYKELLDKRGRCVSAEHLARAVGYFKEQDWRDLQTWFNLAWTDPLWREKDSRVDALFKKGKSFTEEEKNYLLDKHLWICGQIASKHKELQEKGQLEITATPFYHPILPLLCDTDAARMAMPDSPLPASRFTHEEDARHQIRRALDHHEKVFGRRPKGMWPSEGSVSEKVARLFAEEGVRWVATDEAVLARSFSPKAFLRDDLYRPYRVQIGDKSIHFLFRDHELSDAIGFVYTGWDVQHAVDDFIGKLLGIRERLRRQDPASLASKVVPVILDGENCWEYYRQDGLPFLRELYRRLSTTPELQTVLGSAFLESHGAQAITLSTLWSGSWINANFAIWIGHREDNKAWDLLSRTREFLVHHLAENPALRETEAARLAWESIYIAEGSDWCWWYGDDHSSANDDLFDFLFRKHLMNVYLAVGVKPPEDLHLAIKAKRRSSPREAPVDYISPTIDGRITNYFEWRAAGYYHTETGGTGTMHRSENMIQTIYYGYDLQNLYLRFDFTAPLIREKLEKQKTAFEVTFLSPRKTVVTLRPIIDKIAETAIPLASLGDTPAPLEFFITVQQDGLELERWPMDSTISLPYPTADVFSENWSI